MAINMTEDEMQGRAEQLELPISNWAEFERQRLIEELRHELDLIPPADFAAAIGVSEQTLTVWRCTGEGPCFTKTGRGVFYRRDAIRDWLACNAQAPTPKKDAA